MGRYWEGPENHRLSGIRWQARVQERSVGGLARHEGTPVECLT